MTIAHDPNLDTIAALCAERAALTRALPSEPAQRRLHVLETQLQESLAAYERHQAYRGELEREAERDRAVGPT